MPTYDYECRFCGHSFETFQSMSDDSLTTCPECGKEQLRRLISGGAGIIFKGSGFYVNDSKSKSSTATSSSASKKDNKTASESKVSDSVKGDNNKNESGKSESKKTGTKASA